MMADEVAGYITAAAAYLNGFLQVQGRGCIKDSQERQVEEGEAPQTWALGEELQFLGS